MYDMTTLERAGVAPANTYDSVWGAGVGRRSRVLSSFLHGNHDPCPALAWFRARFIDEYSKRAWFKVGMMVDVALPGNLLTYLAMTNNRPNGTGLGLVVRSGKGTMRMPPDGGTYTLRPVDIALLSTSVDGTTRFVTVIVDRSKDNNLWVEVFNPDQHLAWEG